MKGPEFHATNNDWIEFNENTLKNTNVAIYLNNVQKNQGKGSDVYGSPLQVICFGCLCIVFACVCVCLFVCGCLCILTLYLHNKNQGGKKIKIK